MAPYYTLRRKTGNAKREPALSDLIAGAVFAYS
jgi:hypothetical protein